VKGLSALLMFTYSLLLISSAFTGYLRVTMKVRNRFTESLKIRERLWETARFKLQEMESPGFPDFVSEIEPVNEPSVPYESKPIVDIQDVSSLPNLRWSPEFFITTILRDAAGLTGEEIDALLEFRSRDDFGRDRWAKYQDRSTVDLEDFCTGYSYCNVNFCDFTSLKKLFALMIPGREYLSDELQRHFLSYGYVSKDAFRRILNTHFDTVFPVVNASAGYNINTVPEEILSPLLKAIPNVDSPEKKANYIRELRKMFPIKTVDLKTLLFPSSEMPPQVPLILGTESWFWKIKISGWERCLTLICARVPGESPSIKIIREMYQ
jgi:hypothetical protein